MLDLYNLPTSTKADVQIFTGTAVELSDPIAQTWIKPRGVKMVYMFAVGSGGAGGNGAVGARGSAAGGGGGGSGAQGTLLIPSIFLPDVLMVHVSYGFTGQTIVYIDTSAAVIANLSANSRVLSVNRGTNGGNASGATAGTGGTGGLLTAISDQCLAGVGKYQFFAGQTGGAGGTTGAAPSVNTQQTGLMVSGGCGGGGLPSTATNGSNGGQYPGGGVFPTVLGGAGAGSSTPGGLGQNGFQPIRNMFSLYGGTGGASSAGNATGAGLFGGNGGNGIYGCGGGGGGGCLTGGTAGVGGRAGSGLVVIISW